MRTHQKRLLKLGERIEYERRRKNITLDELATQMGISKGNLSDIENGKRDPRFTTLLAIAEGLRIKVSYLLRYLG